MMWLRRLGSVRRESAGLVDRSRGGACPISDKDFVTRCKSLSLTGQFLYIIALIFLTFVGPFKARVLGSNPSRLTISNQ